MKRTFLKAEWRKLAMINYVVDKSILQKYVPANTEIDEWEGKCYVSLIGFMFVDTKVLGIRVPFHVNFEEVNLRFYVRYIEDGVVKRGVVFIKEIVPKASLTFVANTLYKENYETMPMYHNWEVESDSIAVTYGWKKGEWNTLKVEAENKLVDIHSGTEEEFITEHYWGYARISANKTSEYEVEHPRWQIYPAKSSEVKVDFAKIYGKEFEFLKDEKPKSVFLVEGSEIVVRQGRSF
ncbi:YqjF family protein [Flavobacterium sp. '19STA2R22 D10 B1']|uniref:YqjF family protein n=1 Tax=Flavobacterium aerium TaxID=3037261 RepID=UPI00278C6CD2|nr:DUF2071 domain-containing protein [Flavobacterium sp. '19STA2R22 D10 B1']